MKTIVLILTLTATITAQTAFATNKCDHKVARDFQRYAESRNHQFLSVEETNQDEAFHYITESDELSLKEQDQAVKMIDREDVALYLATDSYMSGAGQTILVVNQKSCRTLKRFLVYVE